MTQDPNSDSTAAAALTPAASATTPVPAVAQRGRRLPAEISYEGAALGVGIGLSMVGAAAMLAGGLAEGGPLLAAGLACLRVHSRTPSQD